MEKKKKKNGFMVWLANLLVPRLEKYYKKNDDIPEIFLPETEEDLVWVLKKLPKSVLSDSDREKIMSAMSFSSKRVSDIMLPRAEITFVHVNDFMGPLTLDKLYKSGYSHFPVLGVKGEIAGIIHTKSLNSLEIKDTDRAASFLDKKVYYMRDNYSLNQALAAFIRTNSYFFMVINSDGQVVGLLTLKSLLKKLLGEVPEDEFAGDDDVIVVAKR